VQVQDLVEGEHIGGFSEPLTIIALEAQAAAELVHNIEVENDHTYFVGDSGAWVHNIGCNDFIEYLPLDKAGRPQGVVASISQLPAKAAGRPRGISIVGHTPGSGTTRGHLLARSLGGHNVKENLAPMFEAANNEVMSTIERSLVERVRMGDVLDVFVTPRYLDDAIVPHRIDIYVRSLKDGVIFDGYIPNL
jgi:uncharacterized protein (DUF111 family)